MSLDIEEYNEYAKDCLTRDQLFFTYSHCLDELDFYNSSDACPIQPTELVRQVSKNDFSAQDILKSSAVIIDLDFSKDELETLKNLDLSSISSASYFVLENENKGEILDALQKLGNDADISEKATEIMIRTSEFLKNSLCKSPLIECSRVSGNLIFSEGYTKDSKLSPKTLHVDTPNAFNNYKFFPREVFILSTFKGNGTEIYNKSINDITPEEIHTENLISLTNELLDKRIQTSVSQASIHSARGNNRTIHSAPSETENRIFMRIEGIKIMP